MSEPALDRIGKYEIQAELGRGGFGRVYRAFDPTVGRLVAVKVLTAEAGKDLLTRFRNEATAAGNLHHRNIVTIYEFGEHKGLPFIAMEFLEGEDLQQVIAARRPMPVLEKATIIAQMADGLDYAHRHGVVHRDVKPGNIRLLPDGTVKIMDFGIARVVGDTATRLTRQGHVIGTLLYMAPEQVMGADIDALCDIFAFGVTSYELLAGKHPFQAADPRAVFYKITSEDPEPLRNLVPDCPESLAEVLRRALHKERELRYQSFQDLLYDAEAVLIELRRERAGVMLDEARRLVAGEQMEQAQSVLNTAVDLDPANRDARRLREQVQAYFRRRALQPRIDALLANAEESAARRAYAEAIGHLDAALRLDSTNAQAIARRQVLVEAAERCERAARLVARARNEFAGRNLDAALETLSEAIAIDPESADARRLLGAVQAENDRLERERKLQERLSEARGLLLVNAFEEAAAVLASLEEADRTSREVVELARRIDALKRESERQERLRAEFAAARDLLDSLRFAEAVEALERLKREYPGEERISGLLLYAREELQKIERAQALESLRGELLALAEAREYDRALELLERGIQAHGSETRLERLRERIVTARANWRRESALAVAAARFEELRVGGRFEEALAALNDVAGVDPSDPDLEVMRQRAREDRERARREKVIRAALQESESLLQAGEPERAAARLQSAAAEIEDPALEAALARARAEAQRKRSGVVRGAIEAADAAIGAGRAGEAVEILRGAAGGHTPEPELAAALARADEALRAHERAEALARLEAEVRAAAAEHDFAAAIKTLERGLRAWPDEAKLLELRDWTVAEWSAQQRREDIQRILRKNEALASRFAFEEALAGLTAGLEQYPDDAALLSARDRIQAECERHRAARAAIAEAERLIAAGDPERAVAALEAAGGSPDVERALTLARGAREAKRREERLAEAVHSVEILIEASEFDRALQTAAEALREYPGENRLLQVQQVATELKARYDRQRNVERELARAEELLAAGKLGDAAKCAQAALKRFPGETALEAVQSRIAAERARREREDAVRRAITESDGAIHRGEPQRAVRILEAAASKYASEAALAAALERAREAVRTKERTFAVDQVCREAQVHIAAAEFDRALEAVNRGLGRFGGETRLLEMREAVIAARARWEQAHVARRQPARAARAAQNAPAAVTDEKILPVAPAGREPELPPAPPSEPPPAGGARWLRRGAIAAAVLAVAIAAAWYGSTRSEPPRTATVAAPAKPAPAPRPALPLPLALAFTTDLRDSRALLDGKPAGRFKDGQWRSEAVAEGRHELRIASRDGSVGITFNSAAGRAPSIEGGLHVEGDVDAMAVATHGSRGAVMCPACTGDITVDGRRSGAFRNGSADLEPLTPGSHELAVRTAAGARTVVFRSGPAPALTVLANSVRNTGVLIVEANVDGAAVTIDGKRERRAISGGELRLPLDARQHTVRVEKPGYRVEPAQAVARIGKGEQVRSAFKLEPLPAKLRLSRAPAAARVAVDGTALGSVRADGTFEAEVAPGEHRIELSKEGYTLATVRRRFEPGATVDLGGTEVQLAQAPAPKVEPPPAVPAPPKPKPQAEDPAILRRRLEEADWNATDQGNRDALARFLAKHPAGNFAAQAKTAIAKLDAAAQARQREQQLADDRAAVRQVLWAYSEAYSRKDLAAIAALRPSLGESGLEGMRSAFAQFRSIAAELRPTGEPGISGSTATVPCVLTIEIVDDRGRRRALPSQPYTVRLEKRGGRWVIASM